MHITAAAAAAAVCRSFILYADRRHASKRLGSDGEAAAAEAAARCL